MELEEGRVIQRHADHERVRHDTAGISIHDHVIDDRGIEGRRNTNDETSDIPTPASNDARLNESPNSKSYIYRCADR